MSMVQRYTFAERLCHWTTSFAYCYCLVTGLAFYTPYLFWMAIALGGGPTSRFWHPVLGVGFVVAAMWMHHVWRGDMVISAADKEWFAHTNDYASNQDDKVPPAGKFNAGQKAFYWAMYYGAILLVLSGVVMWFPELVPAGLRWVRGIAILVHESAALLTIGAFIVHIYMGLFMVPGSVSAMATGVVSEGWAKSHHRRWFEQVKGSAARR